METNKGKWRGHYVEDPTLFKALNFVVHMVENDGKNIAEAIRIAANYHKLAISAVAIEFMTAAYLKRKENL